MDENVLTLSIISSNDTQTIKINWVELETPSGNFTICLGHAPITSILTKKSKITYQSTDSITQSIEITGGSMLCTKTSITILLD